MKINCQQCRRGDVKNTSATMYVKYYIFIPHQELARTKSLLDALVSIVCIGNTDKPFLLIYLFYVCKKSYVVKITARAEIK